MANTDNYTSSSSIHLSRRNNPLHVTTELVVNSEWRGGGGSASGRHVNDATTSSTAFAPSQRTSVRASINTPASGTWRTEPSTPAYLSLVARLLHHSPFFRSHHRVYYDYPLYLKSGSHVLLSTHVSFYLAMRMHSADCAVARCPSVHLSVTRRYCVETAKHIVKLFHHLVHSSFIVNFIVNIPTGTP